MRLQHVKSLNSIPTHFADADKIYRYRFHYSTSWQNTQKSGHHDALKIQLTTKSAQFFYTGKKNLSATSSSVKHTELLKEHTNYIRYLQNNEHLEL